MAPRVSIILLNWNNWPDTRECLDSLFQIKHPHYDLVVVDNGSQDDSLKKLEEYSKLNDIVLIKNSENYGFAQGNNIGMEYALENLNPDYILLLNNDTVVDPHFLDYLIKTGEENPQNGIVGPAVYNYHHKDTISIYGGNINLYTGRTSYPHRDTRDPGPQSEMDYLSGCCLLIKRRVIEQVGLLNPHYFLYYEDVEWCYRVKKQGYKIIYQPKAKIWHHESPTSQNPTGVYYLTRNRLWFMKEYATTIQYTTFFLLSLLYFIYHTLRFVKNKELSSALYHGMRDGIRGE